METINNYIEHTLLKADATKSEIEKLVYDAIKHNFFGICINPQYVDMAKALLSGEKPKIVTVVNFPLASNTVETTLFQIDKAIFDGADEIDTVINISALKNKDYRKVQSDIEQSKEACQGRNLKVILETDLLTKDEIKTACKIAVASGANFVKTSTGFVKGGIGAQVDDVKLMHDTVSEYNVGVKASGGIKDYKQALALIQAGATRLGTSSGVNIMLGEVKYV